MTGRRHRERRGKEGGAAAVEFALVLPLLLLLVFGIIQYGLYFWALQGGADAARHAARVSAVGGSITCAHLASEVGPKLDGFSSGAPTIERSYLDAEGNTAAAVEVGDRVEISVTFPSIDLNLPFVPFVNGGLVEQTVQARVDHVPSVPEACS
ncbi:TadE/TadG family type IV pilus assembly protein [Nocardioides deserti]|uniref:Pilus assembly protein n=1 Tax=Nocardioides deserti TaxID=1588644 RepID=A0ABR6UCD2_9ACTN|nr:TadE family protein [Nocardioides deserti]MBC2962097.1 pilus assembly protein [Nocardioides deserti]GGO70169.1 hypothetical protein GCM10012276_08100 [Nocardioides deserti]